MARTGNKSVKAYSDFLHEVSAGGSLLSASDVSAPQAKQSSITNGVPFKANIYSQFLDTENIAPSHTNDDIQFDNILGTSRPDIVGDDTETRSLVESVNKAHEKVQKSIHEYIKAKQTIRILDKCRVDLEEKTSSLITAMQFAESLTGQNSNIEAVRKSVQELYTELTVVASDRMHDLKRQEEDIMNLRELIALLGNPPQSDAIMYQCGYNL